MNWPEAIFGAVCVAAFAAVIWKLLDRTGGGADYFPTPADRCVWRCETITKEES